ncbi:MAG TPA: cupredoxin domain-containing protein [Dehalococcoidia bacterium]|nr:cupredoxin domain-containing protein [Dehalococcoidia bacterium]
MEYVQTVLVQVEAARLAEPARLEALLAELDEHRDLLKQRPAFHDMRVTRSINREGNVLLVIETRWRDADSLVEYETGEPNIQSIINKYQEMVVAGSLQVLDMEALRTEAARPEEEVKERLALPLLVPMGAITFALLVIYGLSRIYLEVSKDVATPLAAGIAFGILLTAAYLAARPSIAVWQIGGIFAVAVALLVSGAIFAVVHENGKTAAETPTPAAGSPTPTGGSPVPGGALTVTMGDSFFEFQGKQNPTIPVAAGQAVTIDLTNKGTATHNMRIAGPDGKFEALGQPLNDDIVSDPDIISGGATATITVNLAAGTYDFRCDFHPTVMFGKINAQ